MPKKIVIFPYGGNARESLACFFAINNINHVWDILGFIDDNRENVGKSCCGISVLGGRDILYEMPEIYVLAVQGNPLNHIKRKDIIEGLNINKDRYSTIIHPNVVMAGDVQIGYNTLIMSNTVIGSGVKIGNHCIMLPNSVVAHDTVIGDYCCIGANVTISGNVRVEDSVYIASGTSIKDNLSIGTGVLIGLGSNVLKDVSSGQVVVGNPAKVLRVNQ
ncbi:MAG: NeuD/PglB/VioB family sugar acetyltransferase [Nitrospirae bacterium]|nr:NeuD/PglB/VioB family sugar acetyltransferase [Nitrospirota bacterium]